MGDGSTSQPSQSFCFADWTRKLQADLSLTPELRASYRHTILEFLGWCRRRQSSPTAQGSHFVQLFQTIAISHSSKAAQTRS
jgi:hypothetical protein